jgi:hypothetical protein
LEGIMDVVTESGKAANMSVISNNEIIKEGHPKDVIVNSLLNEDEVSLLATQR